MEKAKGGRASSSSSRRGSSKRKALVMESDDEGTGSGTAHGDMGSVSTTDFDLFTMDEPKKDWDDHPQMQQYMKLGRVKMAKIGYSSPKPGHQAGLTMLRLAKTHNVKMPGNRSEGAEVLIRALAIKKLASEDPNNSNIYEDTQMKHERK